MYCSNCGNQIDDNAVVCIHCGAATPNAQRQQPAVQQSAESNTIAVVGFVLSFFIAIAGLICSILGLKRAPQYNGNGKGLAIAGIVISSIEIFIGIIVAIVEIAAIASLVG